MRAAEGRLPSLREFEKRAARSAPARLDWPAPANPRDAIDDAEYDLASLNASLKLRGAAATGSARYLMQSNEALTRSLRTRGRRWRNFWSSADGIVDPDPATLQALETHRLAQRSYSPSSLQHFAACPYRFLLHAVFQLRPREHPARLEQMDPLTRGALFHSAQFELFRELARDNLLPVAEPHLPNILDRVDRVLDRVAARYEDELAPAIPRVWKSEIENLRTDLRGWLQHVAATESDWVPEHFEFAFGLAPDPDRDPASTAQEALILDHVRLRGSIDLIERHPARNTLRITDHKTGKAPQNRPQYVGGGAMLQPLLYALAAETSLGKNPWNRAACTIAPSAESSPPSTFPWKMPRAIGSDAFYTPSTHPSPKVFSPPRRRPALAACAITARFAALMKSGGPNETIRSSGSIDRDQAVTMIWPNQV